MILVEIFYPQDGMSGVHAHTQLGDVQVDLAKDTVAFGSGLRGWDFVERFAKTYAAKLDAGVNQQPAVTQHECPEFEAEPEAPILNEPLTVDLDQVERPLASASS